jgi:sigma-B regulation protein RsbU (phosphoserine phosphatase)
MRANELILKDSQSDLFLSAFYVKLDTQEHRMIYSNAGHNPPLWLQAGAHDFKELSTKGIVLGVLGGIELQEQRVDIAPGDVLVFYTDGVTEAIDHKMEEFGTARMKQVVQANAGRSATRITEAIVEAVDDFAEDTSQFDDLTLVVIKRRPEADSALENAR